MLTLADDDIAWADVLDAVRAACLDEDGQDPLDEAARLRLKHHELTGSTLWLADDAGFALVHGSVAGVWLRLVLHLARQPLTPTPAEPAAEELANVY